MATHGFSSRSCVLVLSFLFITLASAEEEYQKINITVPVGTRFLSDKHLLCVPPKWYEVAAFYLANYFAHAATVKAMPGEPLIPTIVTMLFALLYPSTAIMRAISAMRQRTVTIKDPLQAAARAGALCVVVRTKDWKPQPGKRYWNLQEVRPAEARESHNTFMDVFKSWYGADEETIQWKCTQLVRQWYGVDAEVFQQRSMQLSRLWSRKAGSDKGARVNAEVDTREEEAAKSKGETATVSQQDHGAKSQAVCRQLDRDIPVNVEVKMPAGEGRNVFYPAKQWLSRSGRTVFGRCSLPDGYALMIVPSNWEVDEKEPTGSEEEEGLAHLKSKIASDSKRQFTLGHSYSLAKPVIAILQILYASFTLYETSGNQLDQYGYAAFGLTVTPYLVMSVINLTGYMLTADYPVVYLVSSEVMDEARERQGAEFRGVVGVIKNSGSAHQDKDDNFHAEFSEAEDGKMFMSRIIRSGETLEVWTNEVTSQDMPYETLRDLVLGDQSWLQPIINKLPSSSLDKLRSMVFEDAELQQQSPPKKGQSTVLLDSYTRPRLTGGHTLVPPWQIAILLSGALTIGIVGGISRFHPAHSTYAQRVWTMLWFVWGFYMGPAIYAGLGAISGIDFGLKPGSTEVYLVSYLFYCAPAIGGMVVVGQMLSTYGTCYKVS